MPNEEEREISINEALLIAAEKQKSGNLVEAERIYREILDKVPENIDALHLLGLIKYQKGESEEAKKLIERAIYLKNDIALFHGNLGIIYDFLEERDRAEKSFLKAVKLDEN